MKTAMILLLIRHLSLVALIVVFLACPITRADGADWKPDAAGKYLDEREQAWFASAKCVS